MAVLELYGKCKELGYCDCGGFLGCVDVEGPGNHAPALVDCTVCDKSHAPNHPHIANIEGDVPIEEAEPLVGKSSPVIYVPPPDEQLPEWLRDKQATEATEDTAKGRRGGRHDEPKCEVCGKIKRSNHNCKGKPEPDASNGTGCEDCKRAGELCVRHGGVWSEYETAKGQLDKTSGDERIARELPKPVPVVVPKAEAPAMDPELRAMAAIVEAFKDLGQPEVKRVLDYVSSRFGGGGDAS
jgi:hypothetical protein